ncbi:hypothetical protein PHYC_03550 [Phycisphaerales bacterium]|nr:hypothetical protein PHYC_03550 [Phycisphaerales bacterium]
MACLTARTRGGDPDAFEALYRAWFPRVYALARASTRRDEAFCLDAAQDVMLRAARGLPVLADEPALAAWMTRTTMSVCIDLIRKDTRRARRESGPRPATPTSARRTEDLAWLARAVSQLPTADYEVLIARIAHELSLRESGLATGLSEDAAHGRIRRTLARLREAAERMLS